LESYTRSGDIVEGENAEDLKSVRTLTFEDVLVRHPLWIQAEQNSDATEASSYAQPDEDQPVYSYVPPVPQIHSSNASNRNYSIPDLHQSPSTNIPPQLCPVGGKGCGWR